MKMLLEGAFGTWGGSRGFLAVAAELGAVPGCPVSGRDKILAPGPLTLRNAASGCVGFRGGGKGDMEILVTEAEWAWYTLRDWKAGSWMACWECRISCEMEYSETWETYNVSVVCPYYHLVTGNQEGARGIGIPVDAAQVLS